jgi:hypothetical protein
MVSSASLEGLRYLRLVQEGDGKSWYDDSACDYQSDDAEDQQQIGRAGGGVKDPRYGMYI